MAVLATYRRVFSNPALARLLAGEFISSIGDWLYLVALLVVVYQRENDTVILGIVGAARVLPYVFLSVPAGILVDRVDRRMVLMVTDIARGVIMLGLAALVAIEGPLWAIVALTLAAAALATFFGPAIGAYLPSLVRDESELGPANSAWASLDNLGFIVGPAVAGLLIALGGVTIAFVLNAVTFGIVAVILWGLPSRAPARQQGDDAEAGTAKRSTPLRAALSGSERPLLGIGLVNVVGQFIFGGLSILTVVLAVDILRAGDAGTGFLNAAIGIGGLVGAIVSGVLVLRRRLAPPLLLGALLFGGGLALLGVSDLLIPAMLGFAVLSIGDLILNVVNTTLLQRIVDDAARGRVFGIVHTAAVSAYAAGSLLIPIASTQAGLPLTMGLAAGAIVGAVAVSIALLGPLAVQTASLDADRAVLLSAPVFAGLPPGQLESAARRAGIEHHVEGDTIIRQGDEADMAYVIARGAVRVTQAREGAAEPVELRRMGPGEVFGEIGLLSGVPRTATVTAAEPTTLLTLQRDAFLDLVAGSGVGDRLFDLHGGRMHLRAAVDDQRAAGTGAAG
ncbi:MAG TPA: MFS transporter [Candidatus Limnocylindria bacterium]|nr:MFS transporter [Candidatus Limnocylindria bacterium]